MKCVIDAGFPSAVMGLARPRTLLFQPFRVLGRMRAEVGRAPGLDLCFLQAAGIRPHIALPSPEYKLFLTFNLPLNIWGRSIYEPRIEGGGGSSWDSACRLAALSQLFQGRRMSCGISLGDSISKGPCAMSRDLSPVRSPLILPFRHMISSKAVKGSQAFLSDDGRGKTQIPSIKAGIQQSDKTISSVSSAH
ncbi:MAG: hypothetical protein JW986_02040, partial [Methanotrichaceae archaeon]|nr:hypothetical protein [Methanotrichaceae archaeon]